MQTLRRNIWMLLFHKLLTVALLHGNQFQNAARPVVVAHKSLFDTALIPLLSSEEKTALDPRRKLNFATILNVSKVANLTELIL